MRFKNLFPIVILSFWLGGCSESVEPTPYTYTQIFTGKVSKTWKLDRLIFREPGKTDAILSLSNCERDDLYVFYANGEKQLDIQNGTTPCSSNEDDLLITHVWEFNQANASLSMVLPHIFGYFFIPFTVKEAKKNNMELEFFLDEEATISYVLEFKRVSEE